MKKISLKNLNLDEVEQLSREQLKNVLGGFTGSGGSGTGPGSGGSGNCADPCTRNGQNIKQVLDKCVTSTCAAGICVNEQINGTYYLACSVY